MKGGKRRLGTSDIIYAAVLVMWVLFMAYLYVTNPFGRCDALPCG